MFDPSGPRNRRDFLLGLGGIAVTTATIAGVVTAPNELFDFKPEKTPGMPELERLTSIARASQSNISTGKSWYRFEPVRFEGSFSTPTIQEEVDRIRQSRSMSIALHLSGTPSRWANDFERKYDIPCFSMHPEGLPAKDTPDYYQDKFVMRGRSPRLPVDFEQKHGTPPYLAHAGVPVAADPNLRDRFFVSTDKAPRYPNESFDIIFVSDINWDNGSNSNEANVHAQLNEISAMLKPDGVAIFSLRATEILAAIPGGFDYLRSSAHSARIAIRDHNQTGGSWEIGDTYPLDHRRAYELMKYYKNEGSSYHYHWNEGYQVEFETSQGFSDAVRNEEISLRKVTVLLRKDNAQATGTW